MSRFVEEDVAAYVEGQLSWLRRQTVVGVAGQQNFFIGDLPPDGPVESVGLYEYQGDAPLYVLGSAADKPRVERPRIQFTARAERYDRAREMIHDIFDVLEDKGPVTIAGTEYLKFRAIARPNEVTPDSENRSQFSVGFMMWRQV